MTILLKTYAFNILEPIPDIGVTGSDLKPVLTPTYLGNQPPSITGDIQLKYEPKEVSSAVKITCRYIRNRLKNLVDSDNLFEINDNVSLSLL